MTTLDPRPSPKHIALKDFSRYQINSISSENSVSVAKKSFKASTNELKIKRKILVQDGEMNSLPGIAEPLLNEGASSKHIEKMILEEKQATKTILLLGTGDKIKYCFLLLVFTICRGALCPLMAWIQHPIVPKLVWRNLLVDLP